MQRHDCQLYLGDSDLEYAPCDGGTAFALRCFAGGEQRSGTPTWGAVVLSHERAAGLRALCLLTAQTEETLIREDDDSLYYPHPWIDELPDFLNRPGWRMEHAEVQVSSAGARWYGVTNYYLDTFYTATIPVALLDTCAGRNWVVFETTHLKMPT